MLVVVFGRALAFVDQNFEPCETNGEQEEERYQGRYTYCFGLVCVLGTIGGVDVAF